MIRKSVMIQCFIRKIKASILFKSLLQNYKAIILQRFIRRQKQLTRYTTIKSIVIQLQMLFRLKKARNIVQSLRFQKYGLRLFRYLQLFSCKLQYLKTIRSIVTTQSIVRRRLAILVKKQKRKSTLRVGIKK